jgi:flagellar hook-associated protein 3 FlgL
MTARITPHQQLENGQLHLRLQAARTSRLRDQISSGLRIQRPSDDPRAQTLVLNQQALVSHFDAQRSTIQFVRSTLSESQIQVRAAQQLLVDARDAALRSRQITDPTEARSFALEIDGILNSLSTIANARYSGKYLFAGTEAQSRPFPDVTTVTNYQGASESGSLRIAGADHMKTWYSGREVFTTGVDGTTLVLGSTGATGGSGTASGHGTGLLAVRHTLTAVSGGSGVTAGLSSTAGDTIIGPSGTHRLEINDTSGTGTSGTISLNGGPAVAFSSADTDLQVKGPGGEILFVNTTAVTAGFSGTVDLVADGSLSLDNGLTTVPIDFSTNQTLVDPLGHVRHINSTGIRRTGDDEVQLSGQIDIFQSLRSLRDDLMRFEEIDAADWDAAVTRHIDAMTRAGDHLLEVVGEQSVDLQTLDRLEERGEDLQLEAQKRLGELGSTDFSQAVLQLQEEQNLTAFAYAALSGVNQVSVLDFLQ